MFLSKLFGIFKRDKTDQQPSNPQGEARTTIPTTGAVAGGAAASSGLSTPDITPPSDQTSSTVSPAEPLVDSSNPQPSSDTNIPDNGQSNDISTDNTEIAQANSVPAFSAEESSSSNSPSAETSESITPDTDSSYNGSTEEMPSIDDEPVPQPEPGAEPSEDSSSTPASDSNPDEQNPVDGAGTPIG